MRCSTCRRAITTFACRPGRAPPLAQTDDATRRRPGGAPGDGDRDRRRDRRRRARADAAGEPLLVLGGGSNLLVADAGFDGTVVRIATSGIDAASRPTTAAARSCGCPRGSSGTTSSRGPSTEGWAGVEALSGIPGQHGRDAGAERRGVRPGGGRDASRRSAPGTALRGPDPHDRRGRRLRLRLPHVALQGRAPPRRAAVRRARRDVPAATSATWPRPVRLRRARPRARRRDRRPRAARGGARRRAARCGARKGMVLDAADHDTWSAGSFFTNPILAAAARRRRCPRTRPRWPVADDGAAAEGQDQRRLAHRARRVRQGATALPGPASLSTKHTLALTNRGSGEGRGPGRPGPPGARRRPASVRRRAGARARAGGPHALTIRACAAGGVGGLDRSVRYATLWGRLITLR